LHGGFGPGAASVDEALFAEVVLIERFGGVIHLSSGRNQELWTISLGQHNDANRSCLREIVGHQTGVRRLLHAQKQIPRGIGDFQHQAGAAFYRSDVATPRVR
jgi:hypothetical protein